MKRRIVSISLCLISSLALLAGCGKEPVVEESANLQSLEDIYAAEGATTETKAEDDKVVVEDTVDTKALLEDALKGITMVRMHTTVNVDAAPTSKVATPDTNTEETEQESTDVPEGLEEITLDEAKEQGLTENPTSESSAEEVTDEELETTEKITEKTDEKTKEKTQQDKTTEKKNTKKSDAHSSSLDAMTTPTEKSSTSKKDTDAKNEEKAITESSEEVEEKATTESSAEVTDGETTDEQEVVVPEFVETDAKNYFVNMSITTDIDTTTAKTYGTLKMDLGAAIDKEVASYDDFSLEPSTNYIIKHTIEEGADEEGNPSEVVSSKWYKSEGSFYGLATIREILENSDVVSYNESVESHIISLDVPIDLALKLDVTNEMMNILYEGKTKVPMTVYLTKADGILTKIVLTMNDFKGTLSQVDVQTKNYTINFEKHNSINRVMIPDTILEGALEITGEENFISDTDLVKYNFEKLAVEQAIEDNSVDIETTESTETKEETKDKPNKNSKDTKEVSEDDADNASTESSEGTETTSDDKESSHADVDAVLKNTQRGKGK